MKKLALHWKILIGMLLGVLFGLLMSFVESGDLIVRDYIKPFGTIFINLLKLIAIPLILASLIKGVSDLKDISKLSAMGGRTIGTYLITTLIAVCIGLVLVNSIQPGKSISTDTRQELVEAYANDASGIVSRPSIGHKVIRMCLVPITKRLKNDKTKSYKKQTVKRE